ncbi:MAG: hypothetical protein QW764_02965 [Desulfurococcaceae archaeon]
MVDLIRTLFPFFPRDYGRYRTTVNSFDEIVRLIARDNGVVDVYVSVYDRDLHIDKVVWDIDSKGPNGLSAALEQAKRLYEKLRSKGIPSVPVFSGKKGFHIYALFQPVVLDYFTASDLIKNVQEQFILQAKVTLADDHLIGNPSALIRVPNTLNKTRYCVPLPEDFLDWTILDVLEYALRPHDLDLNFGYRPDIKDFYNPEISYPVGRPVTLEKTNPPRTNAKALSALIRPCVFDILVNFSEPPHFARAELVTELNALGYDPDSIVETIKSLNWSDFDESITRKYVEKYVNYLPYSCRRLRQMGIICRAGCRWRYFWKKEEVKDWKEYERKQIAK